MLKQARELLFYVGRKGADGINLRRWFVFYVLYLTALSVAAMVSLHYCNAGMDPLAQRVWLLVLYLFYMSLCCTFFPAPTAWLVLLMASPMVNLVDPGWLGQRLGLAPASTGWVAELATIVMVAAVGALGTSLANLNEYHIFTFLLRLGRAHKLRDTRLYRTASGWFSVSPFALMTVVSLLPIPVDIIRWLAITHRYRRDHYALAYFVGRFVRYGLLATAATCFRLSWREIIIIQATLVGLVLLRYLPKLLAYRKRDARSPAAVPSEGVLWQKG